jgi:ribosome-binding factor A
LKIQQQVDFAVQDAAGTTLPFQKREGRGGCNEKVHRSKKVYFEEKFLKVISLALLCLKNSIYRIFSTFGNSKLFNKMESTRQQKISRLLQKELADIFQKESRTMFMGKMISVTTVRVTPDLSLAKSYISIFPTEDRREVLKQVRIANPKIRGLLGRRVGKQLRVIPGLEFYIDDSLDYIDNIDRLLKQ